MLFFGVPEGKNAPGKFQKAYKYLLIAYIDIYLLWKTLISLYTDTSARTTEASTTLEKAGRIAPTVEPKELFHILVADQEL